MSQFDVILADPAWDYRNWSDARHGAAASAYATVSTEDMSRYPVRSWAAKNAALFMWATWPKLPDALRLLEAWGFEYVSAFPWIKTVPESRAIFRGIGFWTMAASEFMLIGKRGEPKRAKGAPVIGLAIDGEAEDRILYAPRGAHSRKPEAIHEWIERIFPDARKLELFARRKRDGWTTWGHDTGFLLTEQGAISYTPPDAPLPLFDAAQAGGPA